MNVVLASASPRRAELLRWIFPRFETHVPGIEEVSDKKIPSEIVKDLAEQKAFSVAQHHEESLVIAADTLVFLQGEALGKPENEAEATNMLNRLSGRTHEVMTGFAIAYKGAVTSAFETTKVTFDKMSDEEICNYVKTGDPFDKAGGYGIQSGAGVYIKGIEGCYFNVMGLPVNKLHRFILETTKE